MDIFQDSLSVKVNIADLLRSTYHCASKMEDVGLSMGISSNTLDAMALDSRRMGVGCINSWIMFLHHIYSRLMTVTSLDNALISNSLMKEGDLGRSIEAHKADHLEIESDVNTEGMENVKAMMKLNSAKWWVLGFLCGVSYSDMEMILMESYTCTQGCIALERLLSRKSANARAKMCHALKYLNT